MATLVADIAVNENVLPEFDIFGANPPPTIDLASAPGHILVTSGAIELDILGDVTLDTLTGISVVKSGSLAYSISGLDLSIATLLSLAQAGNLAATLDTIFAGNDVIDGSPFADVLGGFGGNDKIDGGAGNDTINGGPGNDTITGGPGNDLLTGGPGKDEFVFGPGFGKDVITDFAAGDKIAISHTIFANLAAVKAHARVDGHHHVVITHGANSITLDTVHHVNDLKGGEFLFT